MSNDEKTSPARLNLEQQRKLAKELLRAFRANHQGLGLREHDRRRTDSGEAQI